MDYTKAVVDYLLSNPTHDPYGRPIPEPPLHGPGGILPLNAIYNRPLKRAEPDDDAGATKESFSTLNNIVGGGKLLGGISVSIESMQHHYQFRRIEKAMVVNILVHIYTPAHNNGRIMMNAARTRCDLLLEGWRFPTVHGTYGLVSWNFNQGLIENHQEFMGSLLDTTRYTIDVLRSHEV